VIATGGALLATLLSVNEAAERLRISVYTLRYLRQEGRFAPAVKIGRRLFWEEKDLDSWLLDQKEPA
jgi:excisionase family DNA binding protein